MRLALTILLLLVAPLVYAQSAVVEMTETDITSLKDFDGARASFRGLQLGMSKADVFTKLKSFNDLTWKIDAWNTKSVDPESKRQMRIYVSLVDKVGDKDPAVLYLLWEEGGSGMNSMVFYEAIAPMLKGKTPLLFTAAALDAASPIRQFLHGSPEKKTDNIGITTYIFADQHFQLISMPDEGKEKVWFKCQN